jgi:hypothetical protein
MPIFAAEYHSNFIGTNINYNTFFHKSDFKSLPGIPNCCPIFDLGYGNDFNYNIFYDYYINENWFIKTSVDYLGIFGYFTSSELELLGNEGQVISGEFEHRIKVNLNLFQINPSINYHWNNLSFGLGLGFGGFINKSFSQEEVITKPANAGTFLDSLGNDSGSRIRNSRLGELPINNHIQFSANFSINYDLPLNAEETIKIIPNLSFEYFINNISNEMNWRAFSVSGGLALSFSLDKSDKYKLKKINEDSIKQLINQNALQNQKDSINIYGLNKNKIFNAEKIDIPGIYISHNKNIDSNAVENIFKQGEVIFEYDTIVVTTKTKFRTTKFRYDTLNYCQKEKMFFKYEVKALGNDRKFIDFDKFKFDEVIIKRSLPLLNYVFYNDNDDNFSKNFKLLNKVESDNFVLKNLHLKNDIDVYNELFNIIASRMKSNPEEDLQIRAYIGADLDFNSKAPLIRAEKIKKYFIDVWGINTNRIGIDTEIIKSTKLAQTSGSDISNELRRVELIGSDILLEPYYFIDTVIYSNPDIIRVTAENKTNSIIKRYEIKGLIDTFSLPFIDIINDLPSIKSEEFKISNYNTLIKDSINFIKFLLNVKNESGYEFETELIKRADFNSLLKKEMLGQKDPQYMKYNLILFDYNSFELNDLNKRIINKIKKMINSESEVEITGFTDELGDLSYNNKLSYARAKAVADELKIGKIKIKGAGSLTKHFINETPESRFYSRVVEVFIINK